MSQEDLTAVIGRFEVDSTFVSQLLRNFDLAIEQNGYKLDQAEMAKAKAAFNAVDASPAPPAAGAAPPGGDPPSAPQNYTSLNNDPELLEALKQNKIELVKFILFLVKGTLNNARRTYQLITLMNALMFSMGIGLFLFAAIYGALHQNVKLSAFFAGLGVASFVTFFILGPVNKTQDALSNLIQAEIAFMNYVDQMTILETFAFRVGDDGLASVANLEKGSALLQQRTLETADLLQTYLETRAKSDFRWFPGRSAKTKRAAAAATPAARQANKDAESISAAGD